MMLLLLGLLTNGVAGAGPSWFLHPPETVGEDRIEVPLYRGEVDGFRPLVHVSFPDAAASSTLAVIDLGGSWTRIGEALAEELGLSVRPAKLDGRPVRRTSIPAMEIGDLRLEALRAEVVEGDGLVLGLGTLASRGIGILPSRGVVQFLAASETDALLRELGGALHGGGQDLSRWREHGERRRGNGLSLSVPVRLGDRDGSAWIRTDWSETRLTEDSGEASLRIAESPIPTSGAYDPGLGDPSSDFVGGLGYDALYAFDLAFDPKSDRVALAWVDDPKWEDASDVRIAIAQLRHSVWVASRDGDLPGDQGGPRIGFAPPGGPAEAAGSDADAALQFQRLADVLWKAGDPEAAVRASASAARAAPQSCALGLTLGTRRLRSSGAMQSQDFVARLVRDPLREAGTQWDAWVSLGAEERSAIRAGDGDGRVAQSDRCRDAWGVYALALLAQGDVEGVLALEGQDSGRDQTLALAVARANLASGDAAASEASIRGAMGGGSRAIAPARFAFAAARHGQDKPMPRLTVGAERPDAVWLALSARAMGVEASSDRIPDRLADAFYGRETLEGLSEQLDRLRARRAGAREVDSQLAIFHVLAGDLPRAKEALKRAAKDRHRVPDYWLARSLLALSMWDLEAADTALMELRMRFPELPTDMGR